MSRARKIATGGALVAAAAAVAANAGAGTSSNRALPFKTVNRGTVAWRAPGTTPPPAWAQVVNRVIDAPGQGEEVDFRTYFGVYAYVMRPTSGYSLTIRRIVLQRFGGYRQICAVANVGKPSGAVTEVKSMSAHYVKIKRGRLGLSVPDHIVLREQHGGVLYAAPGSRSTACKG